MRPFAFFFSVRSIRNAPSPLPRRPARRYRLRTLCTDPESHHVGLGTFIRTVSLLATVDSVVGYQ